MLDRAQRKLDVLEAARDLKDLNLPGNRLESLKGQWQGWHAIRVNEQWRVLFQWTNEGPEKVQLSKHNY